MGRKRKGGRASAETNWIERVKKLTVMALFSDELLLHRFVLKGGNAIDLILHVSSRASVDIDVSMANDFKPDELPDVKARIERSLASVFANDDLVAFDVQLDPMPPAITADLAGFWGGYRVTFKLIESARFGEFSADIVALRRNALLVGASSKLQIDISKYEFCDLREEHDLDGVRISVYTPAMLACEKIRAICQQTNEYGEIVKRVSRPPAPRARDFVDIQILMRHFGFDLAEPKYWPLIKSVFEAKRVPVTLLDKIGEYREFHRTDFQAVKDSAKPGVRLDEFDDYFDDVLGLCERLKAHRDA